MRHKCCLGATTIYHLEGRMWHHEVATMPQGACSRGTYVGCSGTVSSLWSPACSSSEFPLENSHVVIGDIFFFWLSVSFGFLVPWTPGNSINYLKYFSKSFFG